LPSASPEDRQLNFGDVRRFDALPVCPLALSPIREGFSIVRSRVWTARTGGWFIAKIAKIANARWRRSSRGFGQLPRNANCPILAFARLKAWTGDSPPNDEAGVRAPDRMQFILMRLVARRVPLVVVDLSGLTFLSSLAMGALVGFRRDLGRWGGRVKLAAIPPLIYESLQTTRLPMLFEVCATVEEAQAAAS
jgi:anti-anti-sigma factor